MADHLLSREKIAVQAGSINQYLLVLLAFSLPISVSAVTVLSLLIAVFWFIEGNFRKKYEVLIHNPVTVAVLCYLILFVIGLLWSEDVGQGLDTLKKQWKLAMLPVFFTALHEKTRLRCVYGFLAGLAITMTMTYLAWFDLIHYKGVSPEHPTRGLYHVVYNPMLAFALYIVLHEIVWGVSRGWQRLGLGLLAIAMFVDMFITEGRTGQVAFFVLLAVFLLQLMQKKMFRAIVATGILVPLLFYGAYSLSPTFHTRVDDAKREFLQARENPETSVGFRLLFWRNSWQIIQNNPFFGVGTGDFQLEYAKINQVRSPGKIETDNPHNQYIFILCQFGLLGFAVLLAMFLMQMRHALVQKENWWRIQLAFPLFFLTIMLAESYLVVYETGFLFSLFTAVLYQKEIV